MSWRKSKLPEGRALRGVMPPGGVSVLGDVRVWGSEDLFEGMVPREGISAAGNGCSMASVGRGGAPLSHVSGHGSGELLGNVTAGFLRRLTQYIRKRVTMAKADKIGRRLIMVLIASNFPH